MRCTVIIAVISTTAISIQAYLAWKWKKRCSTLEIKLNETEAKLEIAEKQRAEERTGRIRAQRDLRKTLMPKGDVINNNHATAFPMTPIGYIKSCYSTRNGTPRQPLLVTLAKSCLVLSTGVPSAAFDGLEEYSHCWLIYIFHENTDLHNLWDKSNHQDFKAKVRVPRLDGGKLGVFATRTPHRPCPIGLTVAKIQKVEKGTLFLSGADLVDGTPVLDIKPYLPYCDSICGACAPQWVKAGGEDDPLALSSVKFLEASLNDLNECWEKMGKSSLYASVGELQEFITQVLSRDIRSVSQRKKPHNGVLSDITHTLYGVGKEETLTTVDDESIVLYHVVLEGLRVSYTIDYEGNVTVLNVKRTI